MAIKALSSEQLTALIKKTFKVVKSDQLASIFNVAKRAGVFDAKSLQAAIKKAKIDIPA